MRSHEIIISLFRVLWVTCLNLFLFSLFVRITLFFILIFIDIWFRLTSLLLFISLFFIVSVLIWKAFMISIVDKIGVAAGNLVRGIIERGHGCDRLWLFFLDIDAWLMCDRPWKNWQSDEVFREGTAYQPWQRTKEVHEDVFLSFFKQKNDHTVGQGQRDGIEGGAGKEAWARAGKEAWVCAGKEWEDLLNFCQEML